MPAEALEFFGSFIAMDDPRHARQRGIVGRSFTPRRLQGVLDSVEKICTEVIDEICEQLGIDPHDDPEIKVLEAYLPQRMGVEEIADEVKAIVAELGAKGPGDMGKVMGAVKARLAGKADMGQVSAAVKAALSSGG